MTSPVDLAQLPDYLRQQRWFAGKASPIKSAEVLDHVVVPRPEGEPFVLALVGVTYELGSPERYLLPVVQGRAHLEDALEEDATVHALLRLMRRGDSLSSAGGRLEGEPLAQDWGPLPERPSVRRPRVEQSNTSVVLGEEVILKVIRKLEAGVNPEYEMGRFLMTRTRFRDTPELLGALHLESEGRMTVALAHRFVKDAREGWAWVLESLKRNSGPEASLLEELKSLGRVVGELHRALASDTEDPAFAPEPLQVEDLQRWSSNIIGEMGVTLSMASDLDPTLFRNRTPLVERAQRLAHVPASGQQMRIHGDLHLGQVLRQGTRWLIIDFEGEPSRTFTQRREKSSPLKDVAGMLRSLDYAAATVGLEGEARRQCVKPARRAFLEGYRAATAGAAFLPTEAETFNVMLDVFELEKTLYEVRYELQNRPDWVRIPLEALRQEEGESR